MNGSLTSVRVAGGLLPPDVLSAVLSGSLDGLKPSDYHLAGESPREAAARVWTHLLGVYRRFRKDLQRLPGNDPAVGLTRERWLTVLLNELGYGRVPLTGPGGLTVDDRQYPVSHLWGSTPIHLLGWGVELDKRAAGVPGAAHRAPHAMVQEMLNRTDVYLWAIVSNGRVLRLLRDSTTLTGQAYVEFDLEAMFDGELFAEFALLYLLAHQSRVEVPTDGVPADCWLERWRTTAVSQGVRALNLLRNGVQQALETLGTGFLQHPANARLREDLATGTIRLEDIHAALLRTVYRLLFWSVAEDRDALLDPETLRDVRDRYQEHFSSARLRRLAVRRHGSAHDDLWQAVGVVLNALGQADGEPRLGLPGLGGLFTTTKSDVLVTARLGNQPLLAAVRSLSVVQPKGQPRRLVDFRNLGAEELGSIYESLLELVPRYDSLLHVFTLENLAGNDRKASGSYYTPTSLVDLVLDATLNPVLDAAEKANEPEAALLALKVCDPAIGSGHFMVAAARRIATRVAVVRTGDVDPTPSTILEAMHDVVDRCIFGVDLNPMAADLAKVSLWLEAMSPGRPLSFLDHHIKVGNAILGTTPALLHAGIPDAAFNLLSGDDKMTVAAWKRLNAMQRAGQSSLFDSGVVDVSNAALRNVTGEVTERASQALDLADVTWAEQRYDAAMHTDAAVRTRRTADAWCAAFLTVKTPQAVHLTNDILGQISAGTASVDVVEAVDTLAARHRLFHWHLEFPDVFDVPATGPASTASGWTGGFDAMLGNPPFLSPLRAGARVTHERQLARHARGGLGGPKADESSYFLLLADQLVEDEQGRLGLVLPDSFLSANDSADVRRAVAARHDLALIWRGDGTEFEAAVTTIIVAFAPLDSVGFPRRLVGRSFRVLEDGQSVSWREGSWSPLVAEHLGGLHRSSTALTADMSSLCLVTADYRDQYYGLRGAVIDAEMDEPPSRERPGLITTGLVDPLRCLWGEVNTKYDKQTFTRPVVLLEALHEPMKRWAASRLVPKLMIATQGKMPEVMLDTMGQFLPCVPVITVMPIEGGPSLEELAAILISPAVFDYLRATKLGAGLSASAIKVSAADIRSMPAPTDAQELPAAAALLPRLADASARQEFRRLMNSSYGIDDHADSPWETVLCSYLDRPRGALA